MPRPAIAPRANPWRAWASDGIEAEVAPHFKSGFCAWLRLARSGPRSGVEKRGDMGPRSDVEKRGDNIGARNQAPPSGIHLLRAIPGIRAPGRGSLLYRPNLGTWPCPQLQYP